MDHEAAAFVNYLTDVEKTKRSDLTYSQSLCANGLRQLRSFTKLVYFINNFMVH